jgi:hypothetical protein
VHSACTTASILLFALAVDASAQQQQKLAVVTTTGEVWARDLSPDTQTIGPGVRLNGNLFGDHDDQFVVASGMNLNTPSSNGFTNIGVIGVITPSSFWPRQIDAGSLGAASQITGVVSGPDAKHLLLRPDCGDEGSVNSQFFSVNARGEVWGKLYYEGDVSFPNPLAGDLGSPIYQLNGPPLSGLPAKYVVLWADQIFVINDAGEMWVHGLSSTNPNILTCTYNTVGAGHKLSGSLWNTRNDKYVVSGGGGVYVIDNAGEVWLHTLTNDVIGDGVKMNGPSLFGGPNDKYVVTYFIGNP